MLLLLLHFSLASLHYRQVQLPLFLLQLPFAFYYFLLVLKLHYLPLMSQYSLRANINNTIMYRKLLMVSQQKSLLLGSNLFWLTSCNYNSSKLRKLSYTCYGVLIFFLSSLEALFLKFLYKFILFLLYILYFHSKMDIESPSPIKRQFLRLWNC